MWERAGGDVLRARAEGLRRPPRNPDGGGGGGGGGGRLWRHACGAGQGADVCLYTEGDELFWMDIDKTASGAHSRLYIYIYIL